MYEATRPSGRVVGMRRKNNDSVVAIIIAHPSQDVLWTLIELVWVILRKAGKVDTTDRIFLIAHMAVRSFLRELDHPITTDCVSSDRKYETFKYENAVAELFCRAYSRL